MNLSAVTRKREAPNVPASTVAYTATDSVTGLFRQMMLTSLEIFAGRKFALVEVEFTEPVEEYSTPPCI